MRIEKTGQGTVTVTPVGINNQIQPIPEWGNETWARIEGTAYTIVFSPAPGWRLDYWELTQHLAASGGTAADPADDVYEYTLVSTGSNLAITSASQGDQSLVVVGKDIDSTTSALPAPRLPRELDLPLFTGETESDLWAGTTVQYRPYFRVYDLIKVKAVFVPIRTHLIMRASDGRILRSSSGVILRDE